MPRKRAAPMRAPSSSRARGRPKRNTCNTYDEDQLEEEPVIEEQPPVSKIQDPTPVQVLQQLQAHLQGMQQERDRVATAFAARQQVAQTSAQVAEIRQQLALLQAEIQSMQPTQPPLVFHAKYIL
jgi:hypothetical protein